MESNALDKSIITVPAIFPSSRAVSNHQYISEGHSECSSLLENRIGQCSGACSTLNYYEVA